MSMISIKNLKITFNEDVIIDALNLDVEEGETVAILGPSGIGKSTLLNVVAGMLSPDGGEVYIDEHRVKGITDKVAYMPQDDLLFPWKNVLDNVTLYGTINHMKHQVKEDALRHLDEFGLKGYEYKYPHQLSGGMRQRAAFLRTYLCGARVLLLDEPFASLDMITRKEMQNWLKDMKSVINRTTILVTHDVEEAKYLADRVLILRGEPAALSVYKDEFFR